MSVNLKTGVLILLGTASLMPFTLRSEILRGFFIRLSVSSYVSVFSLKGVCCVARHSRTYSEPLVFAERTSFVVVG
jgi:hypothetical protein